MISFLGRAIAIRNKNTSLPSYVILGWLRLGEHPLQCLTCKILLCIFPDESPGLHGNVCMMRAHSPFHCCMLPLVGRSSKTSESQSTFGHLAFSSSWSPFHTILDHTWLTPSSESLHLLFLLPGMLFH